MLNGLHIEYSNVNQAYLLMWHEEVLRIRNTREECVEEAKDMLSREDWSRVNEL
jgi:hypothetical protein